MKQWEASRLRAPRRRRSTGGGAVLEEGADTCQRSLGEPGVGGWLAEFVAARRLGPLVRCDLERERVQKQRVDVGRGPVARTGGEEGRRRGLASPATRVAARDPLGTEPHQSMAAEAGSGGKR